MAITTPSYAPVSLVSKQGALSVGGVLVSALAAHYQTPLYVMDVATIRSQCRAYTDVLAREYPDSLPVYAAKAHATVGLLKLIRSEGFGVDVVSGGELVTALRAGFDGAHIVFHGNNKSLEELELGLAHDVLFVVDNDDERNRLNELAISQQKMARILIRIKPEIEAHTHDYIKTGQIDSKFGFEQSRLLSIVKVCLDSKGLRFLGIHSHIGSQIFDVTPYRDLVRIMVRHLAEIRAAFGVSCEIVNLGGGIGISYIPQDDPPSIQDYLCVLTQSLVSECAAAGISCPKLLIEPGRSIVATCGITIYTVGAIKDIPGVKRYVFIDGGMADNIRPLLYQSQYSYDIANKAGAPKTQTVDIAGKFCESGDVLAKNALLPDVAVGDLLVVYGTGAYHYSMASNYNRFCRPAVVAVENGHTTQWVRRETIEDVLRYDEG